MPGFVAPERSFELTGPLHCGSREGLRTIHMCSTSLSMPKMAAKFSNREAGTDALLQLMKDRRRFVMTLVDGDQFEAISADPALDALCDPGVR